MRNVGQFEKVSFDEFKKSIEGVIYRGLIASGADQDNLSDTVYSIATNIYDNIKLPKRATKGSMGYDFYFPFEDMTLNPGQSITIQTGVKVNIIDEWGLIIAPRSSCGYKYRCQLDDTIGIIDTDYYNNESNEGHISIKITNDSKVGKALCLKKGEAFCQGIFIQYGITNDDNTIFTRRGGIGSTT